MALVLLLISLPLLAVKLIVYTWLEIILITLTWSTQCVNEIELRTALDILSQDVSKMGAFALTHLYEAIVQEVDLRQWDFIILPIIKTIYPIQEYICLFIVLFILISIMRSVVHFFQWVFSREQPYQQSLKRVSTLLGKLGPTKKDRFDYYNEHLLGLEEAVAEDVKK